MSIGLFDVLGPITVGPSSSHTAGAVRIGQIARLLAGGDVKRAEVTFTVLLPRPIWVTAPTRRW